MEHKNAIKLYNTLTKSSNQFKPLDNKMIKMYVCGPTVYDFAHIGNARSFVIYDILYRILRYVYGSKNVLYVRNITDLDDKINNKAKDTGKSIHEVTSITIANFWKDMDYIKCFKPNVEPKATDHIEEMVEIIEKLLASNHAYIQNNTVYFKVNKCDFYYDLSKRNRNQMLSGSRIDIDHTKENSEDFVLWKPGNDEDDPSALFESPWGIGKPGWHIECSAMSYKYCGSDFDIHGGGVDLVFPHHTNEIAQSRCAFPGSKYAHTWIHNGFLTVNKTKMSKSLGNFITVRDMINKGFRGEVIRYFLLSAHYRKPLDYNDKAISDAQLSLNNLYAATKIIDESLDEEALLDFFDTLDITDFINIMCDDMNTPKAFAYLHSILREINAIDLQVKKDHNDHTNDKSTDVLYDREIKNNTDKFNILKTKKLYLACKIKKCANFLGLLQQTYKQWFHEDSSSDENIDDSTRSWIDKMLNERNIAKKAKQYHIADDIRKELDNKGFVVTDTTDGSIVTRKK